MRNSNSKNCKSAPPFQTLTVKRIASGGKPSRYCCFSLVAIGLAVSVAVFVLLLLVVVVVEVYENAEVFVVVGDDDTDGWHGPLNMENKYDSIVFIAARLFFVKHIVYAL